MKRGSSSKGQRLKVAVLGSTGRMGTALLRLANTSQYKNEIEVIAESSGNRDPQFKSFLENKWDVLIDFSAPENTLAMASALKLSKTSRAVLVCTTGFTDEQFKNLHRLLNKHRWAWVPNTSLGVEAFQRALRQLAKTLPQTMYSAHLSDVHHSQKKDAPSGTAKSIAQTYRSVSNLDLPTHSIRAGSVVGEHKIVFYGPHESIELVHRAESRDLFAHGALFLAKKLHQQTMLGHCNDLFQTT